MRKYGFLVIFATLFLVSLVGFAFEDRQHALDEHTEKCEFVRAVSPEANCPVFSYNTSSFWDGFWENWQSEWAQLFVQGAVLVAWQQRFSRKDSENTKQDLREVLDERSST